MSAAVLAVGLRAEVFTEQKVVAPAPSSYFGSRVAAGGGVAVSWHATNRFVQSSVTILMERGSNGWGITSRTSANETGIPFVVNGEEIIYQDVRALNVYRREGNVWKRVQRLEVGADILEFWGLVAKGDRMAALGRFRQAVSQNIVSKLFIFRKVDGVWKKEHEIFEQNFQGFQSLTMASDSLDQRLMALVNSNDAEERWHLRIYRFDYQGSTNLVETRIPAPVELKNSQSATQIAIDGQWAALANGEVDNGFGAVFMYRLEHAGDPEAWKVQQVIRPNVTMFDHFGSSMALSGDKLLVGAPTRNEVRHNAGAAFLFEVAWRDTGANPSWVERRKFVASDGEPGDRFGHWVAFSDDTYVIGAPKEVGKEGGAIYFYEEQPEVKMKSVKGSEISWLRIYWPSRFRNSRLEMSSSPGGEWESAPFGRWSESGSWVMDIPAELPAAFFRVQREAQ